MYSHVQRLRTGAAAILVLTAGLIFCFSASAAEVLEVGGTGSALGTMRLLGAAFEKINPGVKVHVQPSMGSSGAIRAVSKGALDIGLVSRPLQNDETGLNLSVIAYAKTPFILAAGRKVPVDELQLDELARIFRGEQLHWPKGERIRPVLRPETETDTELAKNLSPGMRAAMDAARLRPGMIVALTDQDCLETIEKTPGALGFSTLAQVTAEKHGAKILALDGVVPSTDALASGAYPYAKTLSLVTRPVPVGGGAQVHRFHSFPRGGKSASSRGQLAGSEVLMR